MTSLRAATGLAAGAVLAWGLKAVAIGIAGGLDESPLEAPLFFLGLVLLVAAFLTAGLALTVGRGLPVRLLGVLGAVAVGLLLTLAVENGVGGLVPESAGWVKAEAGLWAISVLTTLVLAALWIARERAGAHAPGNPARSARPATSAPPRAGGAVN